MKRMEHQEAQKQEADTQKIYAPGWKGPLDQLTETSNKDGTLQMLGIGTILKCVGGGGMEFLRWPYEPGGKGALDQLLTRKLFT